MSNKKVNIAILHFQTQLYISQRMSIIYMNQSNKQYQMQHNPKFAIYYAHRRQQSNHKVLEKQNMLSSPTFKYMSQNSSMDKFRSHNKADSTVASRSLKKIQPRRNNIGMNKNFSGYIGTYTQEYPQPQIKMDSLYNRKPLIFRKVAPANKNHKLTIQKTLTNLDFTLNPQLKQNHDDSDANSILDILNQLNKNNVTILSSPKNQKSKLNESFASNLAVQKKINIFLCKNCLQYFEILEVKTHNKQCLFFSQKHEYIHKWQKLAIFIQRLTNAKQQKNLKMLNLYMKTINVENLSKNQSVSIKQFQQMQQFVNNTQFQHLNSAQLKWLLVELFKGMTRSKPKKKQFSILNWLSQLTHK